MIVDDSRLIRQKIERESDDSFQVVAMASNGAEAIEMYQRERPDLVTMDLTMPTLDGIECIKGLIAIDTNVKILVVSALNDKSTGIEALEVGAMGFVIKPFSSEDLRSALNEIVEDN